MYIYHVLKVNVPTLFGGTVFNTGVSLVKDFSAWIGLLDNILVRARYI